MTEPDAFDRVTTRIGDLDHPFYAEERQRDVWNEASAVGFQFLLWALLLAATAAIWVGGRPALPYTLGMLLPAGLAGLLVAGYAGRRGIDLRTATARAGRGRITLTALLVIALAAGLLARTTLDAATLAGAVVGAGLVLVVAAVSLRRARRTEGDDDAV